MSLQRKPSFTLEEEIRAPLTKALDESQRDSHQLSKRRGEEIDHFMAVHRKSDEVLMGHISGPSVEDIQFRIKSLDETGEAQIELTVFGDPQHDLSLVKKNLAKLALEIPKRSGINEINTSTWRGPYLVALPPGKTGLKNLEKVCELGIVSQEFIENCKRWGLTIRWYGLKAKAA